MAQDWLVGLDQARHAPAVVAAGFDDAIDIDRVSPVEGVARLRAMWGRYQARFAQEQLMAEQAALLRGVCDPHRLTARDEIILQLLLREAGKPVSLLTLANSISTTHEPVSINSLRVLMSTLRRKLKPHVSIVAKPGSGYNIRIMDET